VTSAWASLELRIIANALIEGGLGTVSREVCWILAALVDG